MRSFEMEIVKWMKQGAAAMLTVAVLTGGAFGQSREDRNDPSFLDDDRDRFDLNSDRNRGFDRDRNYDRRVDTDRYDRDRYDRDRQDYRIRDQRDDRYRGERDYRTDRDRDYRDYRERNYRTERDYRTTRDDDRRREENAGLGVILSESNPGRGVEVKRVDQNSPADRVGIQGGDRIVEVGGREVDTANELISEIQKREPGESVEITFIRNGQRRLVDASLTSRARAFDDERSRNQDYSRRSSTNRSYARISDDDDRWRYDRYGYNRYGYDRYGYDRRNSYNSRYDIRRYSTQPGERREFTTERRYDDRQDTRYDRDRYDYDRRDRRYDDRRGPVRDFSREAGEVIRDGGRILDRGVRGSERILDRGARTLRDIVD